MQLPPSTHRLNRPAPASLRRRCGRVVIHLWTSVHAKWSLRIREQVFMKHPALAAFSTVPVTVEPSPDGKAPPRVFVVTSRDADSIPTVLVVRPAGRKETLRSMEYMEAYLRRPIQTGFCGTCFIYRNPSEGRFASTRSA